MDMSKRLNLEMRGRKKCEIEELNLDNCRSSQIDGLSDFTALTSLSAINVGLTTLKEFPQLPNLQKLELSDNRISAGLNNLAGCPNITHLSLSGNKIKDFEPLEGLKILPRMISLDLFNCDVTTGEGYREKVFEMLPNLKYLDGFDRNDEEAVDEDDFDDGQEENDDDEDDDDEDDDEVEVGDEEVGDEDDDLDDEEDEDEDEEDDEEEDDEDVDVGLAVLQKPNIEDESDDEDYEGEEDEDDDELGEEEEEEGEEQEAARGVKRKLEDEEDEHQEAV